MSKEAAEGPSISEVLPKAGLVYSEKSTLTETLCKPKIMPIKSSALERLEKMELEAQKVLSQSQQEVHQPPGQQGAQQGQQQQQGAQGGRPQSRSNRPSSARPTSAAGQRQQ
jgi:BBSome-interacting protein 1